ncbi:MAG: PAS domain-containing protein [Trichocoleus desertorum ATA4-8-CV12]|nr:PAS domain-containing protein [Trichocoleus desertorum ATA4-8-CV12]
MLDPFHADDAAKTREQLIRELMELRQRLAAIQAPQNLASPDLPLPQGFWALTPHLDAVFWVSPVENFQVIYVSLAYEQIWGQTCASFYDHPWSILDPVYESDRPLLRQVLEHAENHTFDLEHRLIHADGSQRWIQHQGFAIVNASGQVVARAGIAQDITDKKHDQALQLAQRQILELMTAGAPLSEVLAVLTQKVEAQLHESIASIFQFDPTSNRLGSVVAPSLPPSYREAIRDGIPIGLGMGSCGTAAYERHPIVASDIAQDSHWVSYRDFALSHELRACLSMPILARDGRLLGTLGVFFRTSRTPSPQEWKWIELATPLAGIAIERQQAEIALIESEARLNLALDATRMGTWDWHAATDQVNWSTRCERLFGLESGSFPGAYADFEAYLHPEDRELVRQAVERAVALRQNFSYQYRIFWPDGSLHWIEAKGDLLYDASGQPVRMIGTVVEITERKQAEAALQQLNAQLELQVQERTATLQQALHFEALLKRITDKVRDSLDESQILQTAVQELGRGLGTDCDTGLYNSDQTISTIAYEYVISIPSAHGAITTIRDFPELYSQLLRGQHVQFCRTASHWPRPLEYPVLILACPIVDDQGAIGDLWLFKPTEAQFGELEIRLVQQVANQCAIAIRQARLYQTAQRQVQELRRLDTLKDDFLSTVSHELRTPVANIRMAIEMLEINLARGGAVGISADKAARYLKILRHECEREAGLINNLLDLQRLTAEAQPLYLGVIELRIWLPQIMQPFEERAQAQQQSLQLELAPDLPPVLSDAASLARILSELLNNACKYTPKQERIKVSATAIAGGIAIQVTNTGIEIPASELPRVFDKFYRVPSADPWKQGGTGLGLALVQKLVDHLGGAIAVVSEAGRTQFTLTLPHRPHLV